MRVIKFRGKRVDTGEWVYGWYVYDSLGFKIVGYDGSCHNILPETVGQFTGLTDKNGVEIYEGDVIVFGDKNITQEVMFRNGQYMAMQIGCTGSYIGQGYCDWTIGSEVIGTIHDK